MNEFEKYLSEKGWTNDKASDKYKKLYSDTLALIKRLDAIFPAGSDIENDVLPWMKAQPESEEAKSLVFKSKTYIYPSEKDFSPTWEGLKNRNLCTRMVDFIANEK